MAQTPAENGARRQHRIGYIRTRPVPPGYDIPWGDVFTKGPVLYEKIRGELEAKYSGQYVIIDIVSGEHEIDPDENGAARRLYQRFPGVKPWTTQIGQAGGVDGVKVSD